MKPKVNWKDARKEWPSQPGTYWAIQHGKVGTKCLLFENDKRGITHWAEIEYPEPPEEKQKVSELEKWAEEALGSSKKGYEMNIVRATARKLIEVFETNVGHPVSGCYYSEEERIGFLKAWCGEL